MRDLKELCKRIVIGQLGIIDACRQIYALGTKLGLASDSDFTVFKDVVVAAASLRIGSARTDLSVAETAANDAKVKQIEDTNRIKVIVAATWLEGRISENEQTGQYQHHQWTGIKQLVSIAEKLMTVSAATQGRPASWRGVQASLAFAKVCINAITLLRLIPGSPYFGPVGQYAISDLSTIATQCRCIMEAYYVLNYLVHNPSDPAVQQFHQLLWEYHEQYERCEVVRLTIPDSERRPAAMAELETRKTKLIGNQTFRDLKPKHQQHLLNGSGFKLQSFTKLNNQVGISQAYFEAMYKYCSNFAHCAPFALRSMDAFRVDDPEAEHVIGHLVSLANAYCAVTLREFLKMFPDQQASLSNEHKEFIFAWENMMKWENNPFRETDSNNSID